MPEEHEVKRQAERNQEHRRLIEQVVAGDTHAWQEFIQQFSRFLYSMLRRYADGDRDRLSDLFLYVIEGLHQNNEAGESFCRLRRYLRTLEQHPGHTRFTTWLGRVTQNLVSDYFRERNGRRTIPRAIDRLELTSQVIFKLLYWKLHSERECFESIRNRGTNLDQHQFDQVVHTINRRLNTTNRWSICADQNRRTSPASLREAAGSGHHADRPGIQVADPDPAASPLACLVKRRRAERAMEVRGALRRMLAELSPRQRNLLVARYKYNLPARDIAARLNYRNERQVYARIEALKKKLRRALQGTGHDWRAFRGSLEQLEGLLDEFDHAGDDRVITAFFQPRAARMCLACA